jgi:hypothetical protein
MKGLHVFQGLMAAALAALLPVTARAGAGHSMGGHNMGGHVGMAPRVSGGHVGMAPQIFGGRVGMPPHISSGRGFGHEFGRFDHRHDFAFRHHDFERFRDRDFHRDDRFFEHRHHFAFHHDGDRFRDRDFDRDDRFFHHRRHFFFGFDFASFGFPYPYPYYYDYPYDYSYYDYGPAYDYQYWHDLAVSVQSELARRGYYHGSIDGVIGAGSREAIRAFQAAQGLQVTERIDPKLLKALGISYRTA